MLYGFTYYITVGTMSVAQIEGWATVVPDVGSEWAIESIKLDGYDGQPQLPSNHFLYDPIKIWLLNSPQRQEIDLEWNQHVRDQRALREAV